MTVKASCLALAVLAGCAAVPKPVAPATASPAAPASASPLTIATLGVHRAEMITALERYEQAGVFPIDPKTSYPVSELRDERGVRCPMAELIFQSGRGDLVDAAVRTNNKLRLADVHSGPLFAWMLDSGLTVPEIAMVQGVLRLDADSTLSPQLAIAAMNGQIHGRLEVAVQALRAATPYSLVEAAARLPRGALVAAR